MFKYNRYNRHLYLVNIKINTEKTRFNNIDF